MLNRNSHENGGLQAMDAAISSSVSIIQDHSRGRHLVAFIIAFLALGLLYPRPLFWVSGRYPFYPTYSVWVLGLLFGTQSMTRSGRRYGVSAILWTLRAYVIIDFLVVTLVKSSLRTIDFFSVAGVLLPTFMYEIGMLISRRGFFRFTLGSTCFCAIFWSLQPAINAFVLLIRSGPAAVLYGVNLLRTTNPAWPNGVGMLMAVVFLIQMELSRRSLWKRLLQYSALCILLVTLSRTAMVMLVLGVTIRQVLVGKRLSVLLLACGLALMTFQAKGLLQQDSLEHTIMGRFGRWEAALTVWKDSPMLGQGFRSFDETTGFYWNPYVNTLVKVGSSHNDFVDLLVRGGLVYCLLFVLLIIQWGRLAYGRRELTEIRLCLMIAGLILVGALAQNPLKIGPLASIYWFVIGAGVYLRGVKDTEASQRAFLTSPARTT